VVAIDRFRCAASFLAGDDTASCFGVADVDLTAAAASANDAASASKAADYGMDTSGFFADDNDDHRRLTTMRQDEIEQQQPV